VRPEVVEAIEADLLDGVLREALPLDLAAAVRGIADAIASQAPPAATAVRKAVRVLNEFRHFEHTKAIGDAWHAIRGCDPAIQKHHAQALIELGALDAADALLDEALAAARGSSDIQFRVELPEYRGLRGRIRKQKYVETDDLNLLVQATDEYLVQYEEKRRYWHGINIVALRTEEERRELDPRAGVAASELATDVLELALAERARPESDQWPLATASEACLALHVAAGADEWCERAELWLHRFLNHPKTNPFSIESYARQLREIWHGDAARSRSCADRLSGIIERHVAVTERRWSIDPARVQHVREHLDDLEKNFSGERTFTIGTLKQMLDLCPSIGCVVDSSGARLGTGFLMAGGTFGLEEPVVFVTNAHVISDTWDGSIPGADASVTFETEPADIRRPHRVGRILFTSDPGEIGDQTQPDRLDVTIVSLETLPAPALPLRPAANIPLPSPKSKAFVVGHPASGAMQFSLHDSVLLDVSDDERLMHYRTPTEPGSSGSPVFNVRWEVVALHHAGSPTAPRLRGEGVYEANEGITLRAIRRKLGAA
jgi:V8-like Glu-specific endopeptidase